MLKLEQLLIMKEIVYSEWCRLLKEFYKYDDGDFKNQLQAEKEKYGELLESIRLEIRNHETMTNYVAMYRQKMIDEAIDTETKKEYQEANNDYLVIDAISNALEWY
jgi:hypothetical protein